MTKQTEQFYPFRYDFPAEKAFIPAEVSFRPRQAGNTLYAPTKWQFVGTNDKTCDEKAAWAILCEDLSGEKLLFSFCQEAHLDYQNPILSAHSAV